MCRSRSILAQRPGKIASVTEIVGRRRSERLVSRAAWLIVGLGVTGLLMNIVFYVNAAEDACLLDGDVYPVQGEQGWSWLPPGETCTYSVATGTTPATMPLTTEGSWYAVWTVVLLVTVVALLLVLRRAIPRPTAAAWYEDPLKDGRLRYWDGHEWTEHTAPSAHEVTGHADNQPG